MEQSMFWDAEYKEGEWDRVYSSSDFANVFASFWGDGVVNNNASPLKVSKVSNALSVEVAIGDAIIRGRFYSNNAPKVVLLDMGSEEDRTDCIVLRMSEFTRSISLAVRKGENGQPAPQPVDTPSVKELVLAQVSIPANSTDLEGASIKDMRGTELCPWVNPTFDIQALQEQFNEWFSTLKSQITENAEANLQNQIIELKEQHNQEIKEVRQELGQASSAVIKGNNIYIRTRPYDAEIDTDIP